MEKQFFLPISVFPSPTPLILSRYTLREYHWMTISVFLTTVVDDEAYTALADWLENDWSWETDEDSDQSYREYVTLLEHFFNCFQYLKQRVYSLKPLLGIESDHAVYLYRGKEHNDICLHCIVQFE